MYETGDVLCARLAADVDSAFPEMVTTHQDLVFGVALRVLRDAAAAEDAAQEALVRAYRALKRYPADRIEGLRLRPWLARIALNSARNELRARKQHRALDDLVDGLAAPAEEPARLAERRDERRMWARLLEGLPDRYRLPVALRHVEGLSYPELAEALGKPLGTVKSDVHRGTALLRAAYDSEIRQQERGAAGAREAV